MVKSLYSGVSGLKTHQQRMDVIGNNIANVNTIGNKADVVVFKDVYYQTKRSPSAATSTLGGVNPRTVGYGVQMAATEANMTQSGYTQSDKVFDMAINGNGFFQVMDGSGNIFYTRAGNFNIDESGYLVTADGYHVLGISGNSEGQPAGSEIIRCVIPDTNDNPSSATKEINGTNVTLSVTAPSNDTNISVAFVDSNYPYATFANGILSIYFNRDRQYEDEDAFESAINQALQAGGVTLPDDVELEFDFEAIPDDPNSKTASNIVNELVFTTSNASCTFHTEIEDPKTGATVHPYMSFAIDDPDNSDKVSVEFTDVKGKAEVSYAGGTWNIKIFRETTAAQINQAIKDYLKDHTELGKFSLTSFVVPSVSGMSRQQILAQMFNATAAGVDGDGNPIEAVPGTAEATLMGVSGPDITSGSLNVTATQPGAYANDYRVVFAYVSGYDKTNAVWDENTLTVTVCANTTVSDVNTAIKAAAKGRPERILRFNDISGLDYGVTENTIAGYVLAEDITTPNGVTVAAGTYDVRTTTYVNGYTKTEYFPAGTIDDEGNIPEETTTTNIVWRDDQGDVVEEPAAAELPVAKQAEEIWNPGMRNAFFGGNPSIDPADGDDSFFTGIAKSLSTFALSNGRLGRSQTYKDFTDVTVQKDGRIIGLHPVHGYIEIGRIDLATFDNPNGLAKVGNSLFQETVASGPARVEAPGANGAGEVLSGTLEMSNVDLADEFTNMITTQRGYQANSRVITVSDTMLEELLSLKR